MCAAEVDIPSHRISSAQISSNVRIWYVPHSQTADHCGTLTKDDIAEFASIRNFQKRQRSLATRSVLRIALSEAAGGRTAPHEWRFDRSDAGKPGLAGGSGELNFSCSHTPWASVVAVSTAGPIGVDIENAFIPATEEWLHDVFTPTERAALSEMGMEERERAVSRLWALKEAYLKMLGTGIAEASTVAFDPRSNRLCPEHRNRESAPVTFRAWIAKCQGQRLSVAISMGGVREDEAPRHQLIEEARVCIRAKLAIAQNREDARASAPAPLFRTPSAAAA
ncbi:4'-phosphopantetheinyl transferase family protein [Hyphomicrobium sp.]|uniref:4'-phosphopantetheinyl transferase family protein n=1 Tax=Hyphomicrobium sp. TaxID=82 RepID=UPI0039C8930C